MPNLLCRCSLLAPFTAFLALLFIGSATAQEVRLRVHHFLPTTSVTHAGFIEPWARKVEAESEGRIAVEIYPAMQLGGKPPQLYDQARDGVVDIVWTLTGYTAGRFPVIEVFELPFVPAASAEATSQAAHTFYERHALDEFPGVKPLLVHVHAPGSFHMHGKKIERMEDLRGTKVRAPTRVINRALEALGATAIGMPVPAVPESLSRGVIDGALLPFEVTLPLRVHELTESHTSIVGPRGLYTAIFLFGMNQERYNELPDDLKAVIDRNSGVALAKQIGALWDEAEIKGRDAAAERGNRFFRIEGAELERWKEATQPFIQQWLEEMESSGRDGLTLLKAARDLVGSYSKD